MMQTGATLLKNNNLAATHGQAPPTVSAAIHKASLKTGVDFAYLMDQAKAESSFNPAAKAKTSSASGLFQFIERTWLDMVNRHGEKYGLGEYAAQIDNKLRVGDKSARQEIMALRNDPQIASYMAAEFAAENKAFLARSGVKEIGATELYFAHFLGASGASGFLKELQHNPATIAADIMPEAARANRNVFYNPKTGQARTLQQVYDFFDKKFSGAYETAGMPAPLPPRKPLLEADTQAANAIISHGAIAKRSPVFARAPERADTIAANSGSLFHDTGPHGMKLADYRGVNQIEANRYLLPAPQSPLSIADMLMLSAIDL